MIMKFLLPHHSTYALEKKICHLFMYHTFCFCTCVELIWFLFYLEKDYFSKLLLAVGVPKLRNATDRKI